MPYNIDFLIASLIFLSFVCFHFFIGRRLSNNPDANTFTVFAAIGILDIVLDIVTSSMLNNPSSYPISLIHPLLTLFYILQCAMPFLLLLWAYSLTGELSAKNQKLILITVIPACLFVMFSILNIWTGSFFWFEPKTHAYIHGPYYTAMYIYAFFYAILALAYSFAKRNSMRRLDYISIWEFAIILFVCVGIQLAFPNIMLTGFAIALGLTVMLFTIRNPFAYIDPLTRVYEANSFKRKVQQLLDRNKNFNVVFISFDNLRNLNVVAGTAAGDELLVDFASNLARISQNHQVYRMKGARFAVITDAKRESRRIVSELQQQFSKPLIINGIEFMINTSIACIDNAGEVESSDRLHNYIEFLVQNTRSKNSKLIARESDPLQLFRRYQVICSYLPQAIEQDLFDVYLQPIWDPIKRRFTAAEALSRLHHPELGLIPPDEFISIAEEGLIGKISELQLAKVSRYIRDNQKSLERLGLESIKVNLSPTELIARNLGEGLIDVICKNGAKPSQFNFEITETSASQYSMELFDLAQTLMKHGSCLYMDDFGSGYANLSGVIDQPFQGIKIDKSLVKSIGQDDRASLLCQNIIKMMRELGYQVIVEGVETREQARTLSTWGANLLQGYYFSKPMPAEKLIDFIHCESSKFHA